MALANWSAASGQTARTVRQKVTTVAKGGKRTESVRILELVTSKAAKQLRKPFGTTANKLGPKKVSPNLLPGYPNATINSQYFGSTEVGGTSDTITLSYPYPTGVTGQTLTFAEGLNGFFGQATCNYPQPCTAPIAFQPTYPGLTTNAVISRDQNGSIIYETLLYAYGTAPQFGFDLGNATFYMGLANQPGHVAIAPDGTIYLTDPSQNVVYQIAADLSSQSQLNIGGLGTPGGIAVDGAGTLYIADKTSNVVIAYNGQYEGQITVPTSPLSNPNGVAVDGSGNLFIADTGNNRIIMIDPQGNETPYDDDIPSPTAIATDSHGNVYFADASNGGEVTELSDGSTSAGTQLGTLYDLAIDAADRVYISTAAGLILIASDGTVEAFGGGPNLGMALYPNGNVITTQPANSSIEITDRSSSNVIVYAQVGTRAHADDAISNTGTGSLTLSNIAVSGPTFTDDASDPCMPGLVLQPGALCHLIVDFTPPAANSYQETYTVTSNSLNTDNTTTDVDTLYGNGSGVATSTALAVAPNPATVGQAVTFTATVTSSNPGAQAAPTGLVYFQEGTTTLGSMNVSTGGTAQFSTSSLAAGSHTITAEYGGDSLNSPSTSAAQNVVINAAPTTVASSTTLSFTPPNPLVGQAETFSVSVTGTMQTTSSPTGTVTITNTAVTPASSIGNVTLDATGAGTYTTSTLAAGSYTLVASYSGDANYQPSMSSAQPFTVTAPASNQLTGNLLQNPGAELGSLQYWTIGGQGTPTVDTGTFDAGINPHTGSYDFLGHDSALDTLAQTVSIIGPGITAAQVDAGALQANVSFWEQGLNQGATSDDGFITLAFLDAGNATISAADTGTEDSHNSSWTNLTGAFPVPSGTRSITYTMNFMRNAGSDLDAFIDDNNLYISTASSLSIAPAALAFGNQAVGSTSAPQVITVTNSGTATVTISSDGNTDPTDFGFTQTCGGPLAAGASCTITVTFHPSIAGALSQTITLNDDAQGSPQTIAVTGTGVATGPSGTTTSLFINPFTVPYETPVILSATTTNPDGSNVVVGQVIFCDATAASCNTVSNLGIAQLSASTNGAAVLKLAPGAIGTHTFKAMFLGTTASPASTSAPQTVTVTGMYPTATTIASAGSNGTYSLTGTVVGLGPNALDPTGTVSFLDTTNANASLGTAPLGAATLGFNESQAAGSPLAVASGPYGQATGDFNGDGFLDVVVENYESNTVSVLLGNGDGTFMPAVTYAVGELPERVLVADVNGDGKLDLVVANSGSGSIGVLLGVGDGTFQAQVTYPATGTPVGLGVMDINHDGYPDIVAGDYYENTISVLVGNGDGTFRAAVTYPTGDTPQTLVEGDFNGDGNVDVAVGNYGGASVGIFLGNGDGTFHTMVTYPVGNQPQGVQVGDFNRDGKQDLAVSNSADNTVGVLLGNGDGTFQQQVTYPVGATPVGVVIADFNGDGLLDISVGNTGANTQSVLLGNGDGTFQTQVVFPTGGDPYGDAVGDFNGDGYPDIGVSNFNDGTVTVLLSQVTRTATATATVTVTGTSTTTHMVEASYPGDTNFKPSVSQPTTLTGGGVTTVASSTTLTITPAAATVGQSVAFAVAVSGTTQTMPVPTGMVTLMNSAVTPGTVLGMITLAADGTGTFSSTTLPAGTYSVTAVYGGDSNYAASTSAIEPLVVTAAGSTGCPVPGSTSNAMNLTYFTLAESDRDANYFPTSSVSSNYVLPTLGTNGFPIYNPDSTASVGSILAPHDLLSDNEITWWSPLLNNGGPGSSSDLVATSNAVVSIPFSNDAFYPPNGAGPNDASAFQTAILSGTLYAPAAGTASFSISSDDMAFLYVDGQIACNDGGDHGATSVPCTTTAIGAGAHTLQVFYADLTGPSAALDFSVTSTNVALTASQLGLGALALSPAATEPSGTSQAITISDLITYSGSQPTGAVSFVLNGVSYPATCILLPGQPGGQSSNQEACSAVVPAATIAALPAAAYPVTGSFMGDCNYAAAAAQPLTLTITQPVTNAAPTLTGISPAGGVTGSPATTITLTGTNFSTTDVVQFGTLTLTPAFVNATTLTAVVPATIFGAVATYPVSVIDTAGGLTSGAVNFVVSVAPMVVFTGPSTATSDQQPVVTFQLVQPYAVPINCTLTLTFTPSTAAGIVDPTVQFSSGGTSINVTIPAGSTVTPPVEFQTGTVAGTATVTLTITDAAGDTLTPPNVAPVSVTLPGAVPQITSTAAGRASGMFTVTVLGYSNTREVKTALFHFTPMPGTTLDNPDLSVDVTSIFADWFAMAASDAFGSSFTYTQPFNINADPATIQSVTVTLVNSVGSSMVDTAQ